MEYEVLLKENQLLREQNEKLLMLVKKKHLRYHRNLNCLVALIVI